MSIENDRALRKKRDSEDNEPSSPFIGEALFGGIDAEALAGSTSMPVRTQRYSPFEDAFAHHDKMIKIDQVTEEPDRLDHEMEEEDLDDHDAEILRKEGEQLGDDTESIVDEQAPLDGPELSGRSPLAVPSIRVWPRRFERTRKWQGRVYGLVVHTTGSGAPRRAKDEGLSATDWAVRYYKKSRGCHYVNGWGGVEAGELVQVADEKIRAKGVGVTNPANPNKDQRRSIARDRFELDLPPILVKLWRKRWPGYRDSLALLPGTKTANSCYIHVESPPCVFWWNKRRFTGAEPMRPGLRFTKAQHDTIARLAVDVGHRNGWPQDETWWRTPRLLGHEDLTPISRHDRNGGWDPGYLRENPYFDWDYVYGRIQGMIDSGQGERLPTPILPAIPSVFDVIGSLKGRFLELVKGANERLALSLAFQKGTRNENDLTNLVFFARHPELGERRLRRGERELIKEWLTIRNRSVRPFLATMRTGEIETLPYDAFERESPFESALAFREATENHESRVEKFDNQDAEGDEGGIDDKDEETSAFADALETPDPENDALEDEETEEEWIDAVTEEAFDDPSDKAYAEDVDDERMMQDAVLAQGETRAGQLPVRARILWPALGFPAVIAPRKRARGSPMSDGDATRCICVLLVSDRKYLSKEEAARYLRYVPWEKRGKRHIPSGRVGAFLEEQLSVRNDASEPALTMPGTKDHHSLRVAFGGNRDGDRSITVTLAKRVRQFYRDEGLAYLHEVRISEQASGKLADGRYHLFWNNEETTERAPSDEMALLLRKFATPRRATLGRLWRRFRTYLLREYEYEYRPLHPYSGKSVAKRRAEILHPLFINRQLGRDLRVGHLTDTHVSVRNDAYAVNLKRSTVSGSYNNWNTSFLAAYDDAKEDSEVVLITGDLIDYGRGHWGRRVTRSLGKDTLYQVDRNWFLFHDLLASGDAYRVPVYTILGNHDWRLNPYPPFAPGSPKPKDLIHDHPRLTPKEQKDFIRAAHGPGHDKTFAYAWSRQPRPVGNISAPRKAWLALGRLANKLWKGGINALRVIGHAKTLDVTSLPTETTVESVLWYLLAINPFFDFAFALPSSHRVLMLDWAEDEDLLFPIIYRGEEWPYMVWHVLNEEAATPGPKAKRSLTPLQKRLVDDFVRTPGRAKLIGIHAPPIGPYPDWFDTDLLSAKKIYKRKEDARGPTNWATKKRDGTIVRWNGHPIFATPPKSGKAGMDADYGSFTNEREWFIKRVGNRRSGVRAIFSGHIHRKGLYVVPIAGKSRGSAIAGERLVYRVVEDAVRGARAPAVTRTPEGRRGPLYVNTTSAGPRGNFKARELTDEEAKRFGMTVDPGYTHLVISTYGTIRKVAFRSALATGGAIRPTREQEAKAFAVEQDEEMVDAAMPEDVTETENYQDDEFLEYDAFEDDDETQAVERMQG